MELAEKIIRVSLKKNDNKTMLFKIDPEFTILLLPAQDRTETIQNGYILKRENINHREIPGLSVHLINVNGKTNNVPYVDQTVSEKIDISEYSSFYFDYNKIDEDIEMDVFLFADKKQLNSSFFVSKKEYGTILNMRFTVNSSDVFEGYLLGATEINGYDFTPLAKELAIKYNIHIEIF